MINQNRFNNSILRVMNECIYDVYTIERNLNIKCTCVTHATDQADAKCHKCLGTGYKITIKKVKAAAQDTQLPPTFRSDKFLVARNYFMPTLSIVLKEDDLLVDDESVYTVFEFQKKKGINGSIPYTKISAVKKKFDSSHFIQSFNNIIRRR